jgi:aminocarboxymuconate-semialdehyde decarboxylase
MHHHDRDCGGDQLPRRHILQGGLAAAAMGALGAAGGSATAAQPARAAAGGAGAQAIDIHAHYFPQAFLDQLAQHGRAHGLDYRATPEGFSIGPVQYAKKFTDLDLRLAEMDERGVEMHALSLTSPMLYWAEPEAQVALARAWNDAASAAHKAHPTRFVGLATLPMGDPERAVDELNRVAALQGIRGVYLGTNIEDRDLDDPRFTPVFARIEALNLPVFLHPLKTLDRSDRMKPYYLGNLIGNPLDTAIASAHLIFGGVLDRFPNLEICLPHAGGVVPMLIGRWDHGATVRKELAHLKRPPSDYLRRFTYDTVAHSPKIMKFVIDEVGIDRIMLGSDYCFDMGYTHPVEVVDALGLNDKERHQVLRGTAARLLRV